jgi:YfiH family protein
LQSEFIIIRSQIFSHHKNVCCGISTRNGGVSPSPFGLNLSFSVGDEPERVTENRKRFFTALGITLDQLAIPRQIHSNTVQVVETAGSYPDCDALMTNRVNIFLVVSVADCVPIFLYDEAHQAVAIAHAGWRGTTAHIVKNTVAAMQQQFQTQPSDLKVFIGHAASLCCYEVGNDIAGNFPDELVRPNGETKSLVDLKGFNTQQLVASGVREECIEVSNYCTICTPQLFHSYRRDGSASGRMMGVIGLRG